MPTLFKAKCLDATSAGLEAVFGRRFLNRVAGYVYLRTRGEHLFDPERNGEYHTLDAIARHMLPPGAVALDVGANIGDWSERFLRVAPGGRVLSFEPVSDTFQALRGRFASEPRAECVNAAVSDREGTCDVRVSGERWGSNSIYEVPGETCTRVETVRTIAGDALMAGRGLARVDFVKIDVEGHELRVLRGFRQAIAGQRIRFLQWEYNDTWIPACGSLREVFALLAPAGYRLCKLRQRGLLHYSHHELGLETFRYSNWLAVADPDFAALRRHVRILDDTEGDA
jgi:FkbM family methyltransferase